MPEESLPDYVYELSMDLVKQPFGLATPATSATKICWPPSPARRLDIKRARPEAAAVT